MNDSAGDRTVNREEITRLLRARGERQTDLARALGVRDSAVSDLLRGKRAIRDRELPVFAAFLGIGIDAALRLLGIDPRPDGRAPPPDTDGADAPEDAPEGAPVKTVLHVVPSPDPVDPRPVRPQLVDAGLLGSVPAHPQDSRAIPVRRRDRRSALQSPIEVDRA